VLLSRPRMDKLLFHGLFELRPAASSCGSRARSIRIFTLLIISSSIGPRDSARELIARRAGTLQILNPAFAASGVL